MFYYNLFEKLSQWGDYYDKIMKKDLLAIHKVKLFAQKLYFYLAEVKLFY